MLIKNYKLVNAIRLNRFPSCFFCQVNANLGAKLFSASFNKSSKQKLVKRNEKNERAFIAKTMAEVNDALMTLGTNIAKLCMDNFCSFRQHLVAYT